MYHLFLVGEGDERSMARKERDSPVTCTKGRMLRHGRDLCRSDAKVVVLLYVKQEIAIVEGLVEGPLID